SLQTEEDWELVKTEIKDHASIGTSVTILGGITIGFNALIGAGSVVTKNIPDNAVAAGNPAKIIRFLK
ncbi:MAG: N-acetyltransferase, partial [Flavobacteriales bacterium]